jgi:hypothetical protein
LSLARVATIQQGFYLEDFFFKATNHKAEGKEYV